MIELFRKNLFINSLLLLPYTFIVRIHSLLNPTLSLDEPSNSLQAWALGVFSSPLSQEILASIFVFIQAVYLNRIVIRNRLSQEITLLPGLCYIVLCSLIPSYTYLSLPLISNFFILLFISKAFKIYKRPKAASLVFDIGLLISIAAIFYWPAFIMILAGYISLMVLRSVKWQDRIQLLCGVLLPFALWWVYAYCYTENGGEVMQYLGSIGDFQNLFGHSQVDYLYIAMVLIIILSTLFKYGTLIKKKSIQVQKKIDILYWVLLCSGLSILWASFDPPLLLISWIPIAYFLSQGLLSLKKPMNAELIHLFTLVFLFLLHFGILPSIADL